MDAAMRALAEPIRREILRVVRDDELTAGDIAARFPITRPAVSQHLRALEDAELVTVRRDGTRRWYRARPEGLSELQSWLTTMWAGRLADLKRAAEQEEWPARQRAKVTEAKVAKVAKVARKASAKKPSGKKGTP